MHDAEPKLGKGLAFGIDQHGGPIQRTPGALRSLAPCADMLPHGSNDSRTTNSQLGTETESDFQQHSNRLGNGTQARDATGSNKSKSPATERQLGLFVETKDDGMAHASQTRCQWRRFRACDLVRLLNATPLGPVINDRQLYRHRQRAPWIQCGENQIDLLRYVAWLVNQRHTRKPRKRRIRGRQVLTLDELREILRSQDFRCALTGQPLTPTNFALDHIVPIVDGGDFTASNAQLVLKTVNRAKNTMSEPEFIEMCRQVARHRGAVFATNENPVPTQGVQP